MYEKKLNQRGIVSFFTVIFLSVILITMTTAFVKLMISSQRESTNNDLSTRAYYAAEAGVDDAMQLIKAAGEDGEVTAAELQNDLEDCGLVVELDAEKDISYTCRYISLSDESDTNTNAFTGSLEAGEAENIDLDGADGVASIEVSWHSTTDDGSIIGLDAVAPTENLTNWGGRPAIMRLQAVQYPSSGIVSYATGSGTNIDNSATFAYPDDITATPSIPISQSKGSAFCNYTATGLDYACRAIYTGFNTGKYKLVRLRALNNSANFRLVPLDSANNPVPIPNQVTIDVTGKAGNVYRRIRIKASIADASTGGGASNDFNINHALLVDEDICKDLEVDSVSNEILEDACN